MLDVPAASAPRGNRSPWHRHGGSADGEIPAARFSLQRTPWMYPAAWFSASTLRLTASRSPNRDTHTLAWPRSLVMLHLGDRRERLDARVLDLPRGDHRADFGSEQAFNSAQPYFRHPGPPPASWRAPGSRTLRSVSPDLDVVEAVQADTALEAFLDLARVVLEALQGDDACP